MSIFGYPMDSWVHTGTLVFLSLRAREYTGGDLREKALKDRVWSQYWASWMPEWIAASQWLMSISSTLWTQESTQVLWCSWVLGQGRTEGTISVKWRNKKGFDHNIGQAERHSELPRPNGWCPFSGTLWTHESTQVLWCSWVLGQGSTHGEIAVK